MCCAVCGCGLYKERERIAREREVMAPKGTKKEREREDEGPAFNVPVAALGGGFFFFHFLGGERGT